VRSYHFDIPLGAVKSPLVAAFDAYWRAKRRNGLLPGRADIDPVEIKRLLPNIVLLDLQDAPFRVRIRLVGTAIAEFRGDNTGKYLDELTGMGPERRDEYLAQMRLVATEARPAFACDRLVTRFGTVHDIYAGVWPLATDGRKVDKLVAIEDYGKLARWQLLPD
jgi:hypothetical protein